MSGLDDDTLRAMLAARADRVSPNVAGEVMVKVRAEVRGPRQGAAFSVLPVLAGRTPAIGAGWAAAAMIAVIVMVIVATRPPAAAPSASVPGSVAAASSTATASSSAPTSPSTSSAPLPTGGRISLADLLRAVGDRSLDGRLLLVDSTLRNALAGCSGDLCPQEYRLDLVGPVVTQMRPAFPVVPATPEVGTAPLTGTFVVVPFGGSLILVGRMLGSLASPLDLSYIRGFYQPSDAGASLALQAVDGRLVRNTTIQCASGPCPPRDIIVWGGATGSANGAEVLVDAPALGIDSAAPQVAGPFLVRTGTGSRLEVAARYDLASVTTVDLPPVTCQLSAATNLPSCSEVVAEALAGLQPIGTVTAIEADQGAYCAPGMACPTVEADRVHVIVHTSSGDWLISLAYGPDGRLVSAMPEPLPSADPGPTVAPSAVPTTCSLPTAGTKLPRCEQIVADALAALATTPGVTSVDVSPGAACHAPLACAPVESSAHVTVHSPSGDLLVSLVYGTDGTHVATVEGPSPSP